MRLCRGLFRPRFPLIKAKDRRVLVMLETSLASSGRNFSCHEEESRPSYVVRYGIYRTMR